MVTRAFRKVPAWAWFVLCVYVASRLLYLGIAGADVLLRGGHLAHEMSQWDGQWYLRASLHGYPHTLPTHARQYSTLGFLPLYPLLMKAVAAIPGVGHFAAGLTISMITGCIATLAMSRLAARWWGEAAARRAIVFFCLFPGTIVFSMVYSEGLELMLIALALLALEDRRWLRAGIWGGFATATSATATAIIPAALVAALIELHQHGWLGRWSWLDRRAWRERSHRLDRRAWRSLLAPVLSCGGLIAFGIYLWSWAGTPLASYIAQKRAWQEKSTPFSIPELVGHVFGEIFLGHSVGSNGPGGIDINAIHGLLGLIVMVWGMYLLWRSRDKVHITALIWTLVVFLEAVTSPKTPPNARMLICTFPALLAIGSQVRGRWRWVLLSVTLTFTLVMSYLTYLGPWLRP